MGKKKQRVSKPITGLEREQLRMQIDMVGQEDQHLMGTDASGNMRRLRSRNVPIPIPPKLGDDNNSVESFDPGIRNKPPPLPLLPPLAETAGDPVEKSKTSLVKKPDIPPKPTLPKMQNNGTPGVQVVTSEMESDDYHHISEQLSRAAEKINKNKLALDLQDKDKRPSCMSESDKDCRQPHVYPYDDGEVTLRAVMSPDNSIEGSKTSSVDQYLTPRPSIVNQVSGRREPRSSSEREELKTIEMELGKWTGAGTQVDGKYYSSEKRDPSTMKPIERAIIYHPPSRVFVRVDGKNVRVIAHMPISSDQLTIFKRFPCYSCYDPIRESTVSDDLAWDSFQTIHSEVDPTYETPRYDAGGQLVRTVEEKPRTNSFGNSVDLTRYGDGPQETETSVEYLLDTKTHLQEQLRDLSSESNGEEENLPKTLGEHQMQNLMDLKSIRDVQTGKAFSGHKRSVYSSDGSQESISPTNNHVEDPSNYEDESNSVRFSQVAHLKEYLQSNIQILQEQIEWNTHMKQAEMQLREQGTTMTPTTKAN